MTRRAPSVTSRIIAAALIVALAIAAAMAGAGDAAPVYAQTTVDYDDDNDGLIDIRTLAQLDAVRYNLNGRGDSAHGSYAAAFPNRDTTSGGRMGCPSGACTGYELRAHLDFDTNGNGYTYTGTGASAASDSGDDYHNGGSGWLPIGGTYTATFKGNGYVISNLFIKRTTTSHTGLFSRIGAAARVESMGMKNAFVHGQEFAGALAARNQGTVVASWSSGAIRGLHHVAGLIGVNTDFGTNFVGNVLACYSHASVYAAGHNDDAHAGGLVGTTGYQAMGRIEASYAIGSVTSGAAQNFGGLATVDNGVVTNSYWNSETSGSGFNGGGGSGQTTNALRNPLPLVPTNWQARLIGGGHLVLKPAENG